MEDIFDIEKEIIHEAENLLQEKKLTTSEDEESYKKLLDAYKRLLKQMRTMVRMSDIMQLKLNTMSSELEKLSQIDGLTGLYNRRFFNEIYQKEWQGALASGKSLGAMMIDIDYFKVYNDTYGHLVGDGCLQKISSSIGQAVKDCNAFVGRFGGEEFIVLLPDTNSEQCTELAQIIMNHISQLGIASAIKNTDGNVTVSIGIGLLIPTQEMKPEILVNLADQALYRAKKDGRNCYRF